MPTRREPASTATWASLGRRLRAQRLAREWRCDEVAAHLRMPVAFVEAMERDEHAKLGSTFHARSRLIAYAVLVDVPVAAVEAQFAHAFHDAPGAVEAVPGPRAASLVRRSARPGIQLVLAASAAIALAALVGHGRANASAHARSQDAIAPVGGEEASLAPLDVTRDSAYIAQDEAGAGAETSRSRLSSARKPAPVKH